MNGNLQEKYNELLNILRSTGGLAVAFSGGVDSAFLVYAAHEALGGKLLAITAVTQSYPRHEAADAARILAQYGVKHEEITLDQLAIPGFCQNSAERCYYCKYALFTKIKEAAQKQGISHMRCLQKLKKQRKSRASAVWLTAPIPMTKAITDPACAPRRNLAF